MNLTTRGIPGVVRDSAGNVVENIFANDIAISKVAGLIYVTAGAAVYVIDAKDPYNPIILNIITQAPDADGNMTSLGISPALAEKDGWVYLANQQHGLRVLDLDPREIGIQPDVSYSHIRIPETDYYPGLGTKGLTIYGVISGLPLGNDWALYLAEPAPAGWLIGGMVDGQGMPGSVTADPLFILRFTASQSDKKGFVPLYLRWNGAGNAQLPDNVTFRLQARKIGATSINDATSTKIYAFTFRSRHNGNVTLKEVIDGRAVFAADGRDSISTGSTPDKQRFDFVKEMLNQVVPRKRTLNFNIAQPLRNPNNANDLPYKYDQNNTLAVPYIEETSGQFETDQRSRTSQALEIFRRSFGMGNTTLGNASDIMSKVIKDYTRGMADDQKAAYLYKIVEQQTLVGETVRIPNWFTGLFINADNRINNTEGNTVNDTGLYELYKNVVEEFMKNMIKEADQYAGAEPTDAWRSRNNYGPKDCKNTNPPSCVDEHGPGMSYSFGGNADIKTFNERVSVWQAPPNAAYNNNQIPVDYRGNIDDSDGFVDDRADDGDPVGTKQWAGLREPEWKVWNAYFKNLPPADCNADTGMSQRDHRLYPQHWAGIDCSAFAQRVINNVDPSVNKSVDNLPGVRTTIYNLADYKENCTTRLLDYRAYVGYFFDKETRTDAKKRTHYVPMASDDVTNEMIPKLRKGDLVRYDGHVSIVYSEKAGCTDPNDSTTCTYEIVHASGSTCLDIDGNGECDEGEPFNRKVVVNSTQFFRTTPTGFGRIKLWD